MLFKLKLRVTGKILIVVSYLQSLTTYKNISLTKFRKFLIGAGCKYLRSKGGHEIWAKEGLRRPIAFPWHTDTLPFFVIRNNLKTLGLSYTDFQKFFQK